MSRNIPDSISVSLDILYLFEFFDLSVHLEDNIDIIKEALIFFVKEMLRGTIVATTTFSATLVAVLLLHCF